MPAVAARISFDVAERGSDQFARAQTDRVTKIQRKA
jgi:hypothetical protein